MPPERAQPGSLDPGQPIPVYFQLKRLLLEEILGGQYGTSGRLPTEHELCRRYRISRTPVNRALSELAAEGVILRRRRHGTFVNPHWLRRNADGPELRVLVPEGPWERQIRAVADVRLNVARVALPELHHVLTLAVAEGRGPDLALIDSVWVTEFATAGFVAPLDELDPAWVAGEYEADFLEPFVAANRHAGRPVAVQAEADVAGFWYRRADLEALELAVPETWEALVAAAIALRARHAHPLAMPAGSRAGETATYCLLALLATNGVAVLDDGAVTLASPAAVEAMELLLRLVDEGVVAPDVVAYEWDRPIRMLAHGDVALSFGGSYDGPALAAQSELAMDQLWEHYGFARMPAGPRGVPATLAGGMAYAVLRQAEHPSMAMRLLQALTSTEACLTMSRETAQIPPRRSAVALVAAESPFIAATAGMLASAAVRPSITAYPRVSAQLQAMLEAVLTRRLAPADAVAHAAELISAVTGLPLAA